MTTNSRNRLFSNEFRPELDQFESLCVTDVQIHETTGARGLAMRGTLANGVGVDLIPSFSARREGLFFDLDIYAPGGSALIAYIDGQDFGPLLEKATALSPDQIEAMTRGYRPDGLAPEVELAPHTELRDGFDNTIQVTNVGPGRERVTIADYPEALRHNDNYAVFYVTHRELSVLLGRLGERLNGAEAPTAPDSCVFAPTEIERSA